MKTTEQIAAAYRAATVKGAWYGPALAELLEKTTAEEAVTAPLEKAHSISELLQHLLLWNERIRKTSESTPLPKWEAEKDWAEPAMAWSELLTRWNRSRDGMEERIRNFPAEDLGKQVPGRTYAYEVMYRGSVEHVIYHAGQMAMVRSMLRSRA
jgi:uncharacterized damage-inducible protein DinB